MSQKSDSEQLPPHSPAAEVGVLGCCLLDPKNALDEALVHLASRREAHLAFYDLRHQIIFKFLIPCRDAQHFVHRSFAQNHFFNSALPERAHPQFPGLFFNIIAGSIS